MRPSITICILIFAFGCQARRSAQSLPHEDLDAALWVQTSAEYLTLATMAYDRATTQLSAALRDPAWSAIPEQAAQLRAAVGSDGPTFPTAVILDVDETVLDNGGYQTRQIENGAEFDASAWETWVSECRATAVPGASEFIQQCRDQGVVVIFVTNRHATQERYTRRNLQQLGLIDEHAVDNILSKYERDEWTTNKTSRRDYVTARYRVLLLVGDDLNDFAWAGDHASPQDRRETAAKYTNLWGDKWFLIPNPNYGGWEKSISDYDDSLSRSEILAKKHQAFGPTVP